MKTALSPPLDPDTLRRIAHLGRPPAWDRAPLDWHLRRSTELLRQNATHLLRRRGWSAPAFDEDALRTACGDRGQPGHVFRVDPLVWGFNLTEPQITGALAHFLDTGDVAKRRTAFLAVFGCAFDPSHPHDALEACVKAEADGGNKGRIDLLIKWRKDRDGRKHPYSRCLAIEAKTGGYKISNDQLTRYRRRVVRGLKIDDPTLAVVAPRRDRHTEKKLNENRDWRFATWRSVLWRFERELGRLGGDPDQEFARFRRTIWHL